MFKFGDDDYVKAFLSKEQMEYLFNLLTEEQVSLTCVVKDEWEPKDYEEVVEKANGLEAEQVLLVAWLNSGLEHCVYTLFAKPTDGKIQCLYLEPGINSAVIGKGDVASGLKKLITDGLKSAKYAGELIEIKSNFQAIKDPNKNGSDIWSSVYLGPKFGKDFCELWDGDNRGSEDFTLVTQELTLRYKKFELKQHNEIVIEWASKLAGKYQLLNGMKHEYFRDNVSPDLKRKGTTFRRKKPITRPKIHVPENARDFFRDNTKRDSALFPNYMIALLAYVRDSCGVEVMYQSNQSREWLDFKAAVLEAKRLTRGGVLAITWWYAGHYVHTLFVRPTSGPVKCIYLEPGSGELLGGYKFVTDGLEKAGYKKSDITQIKANFQMVEKSKEAGGAWSCGYGIQIAMDFCEKWNTSRKNKNAFNRIAGELDTEWKNFKTDRHRSVVEGLRKGVVKYEEPTVEANRGSGRSSVATNCCGFLKGVVKASGYCCGFSLLLSFFCAPCGCGVLCCLGCCCRGKRASRKGSDLEKKPLLEYGEERKNYEDDSTLQMK